MLDDADYLRSLLGSLPGVDPNDPALQATVRNLQARILWNVNGIAEHVRVFRDSRCGLLVLPGGSTFAVVCILNRSLCVAAGRRRRRQQQSRQQGQQGREEGWRQAVALHSSVVHCQECCLSSEESHLCLWC